MQITKPRPPKSADVCTYAPFQLDRYLQADGGSNMAIGCKPARIDFRCDRNAGLGEPRFVTTDTRVDDYECGTVFEWATAAVRCQYP